MKLKGIVAGYKQSNNIPEAYSPFGGASDMEHIHTTYHTPLTTTKTNSVHKRKNKTIHSTSPISLHF